MSYQRLAYHEQDTAGQMHLDCLVCASQIKLPHEAVRPEPVELERQQVHFDVSVATADLASRLYVD